VLFNRNKDLGGIGRQVNVENWVVRNNKTFKTDSDGFDLCWSPDNKFIAIGTLLGKVVVHRVQDGAKYVTLETDATVKGVAWDPCNKVGIPYFFYFFKVT